MEEKTQWRTVHSHYGRQEIEEAQEGARDKILQRTCPH
jgi:hypothetical protein